MKTSWLWNAMSLYAQLAWLTLLFVLGALPLVTVPASFAALRLSVAQLIADDRAPSLSEYIRMVKRLAGPSLPVIAPAVALGSIGCWLLTIDAALLRGSGIALLYLAITVAAAAMAAAPDRPQGGRSWGRRCLIVLLTRPARCGASSVAWLAAGALVLVLPAGAVVPIGAVLASGTSFVIEKYLLPSENRPMSSQLVEPNVNYPTPAASSVN